MTSAGGERKPWLRNPSRDWGAVPYLVLFGILGTLARIGLVEQFSCYNFRDAGAQCNDLGDGVLFRTVAANMAGSFIMGILATSAMASRPGDDPPLSSRDLAAAPPGWLVQTLPRLLAGLRTGFCGALTTYSGWNQAVVERAAAGGWARALAGLLLGTELFVSSLVAGQHAAAAIGAEIDRREAAAEKAVEEAKEGKAAASAGNGADNGDRHNGAGQAATATDSGPAEARVVLSDGDDAAESSSSPAGVSAASNGARGGDTVSPLPSTAPEKGITVEFPTSRRFAWGRTEDWTAWVAAAALLGLAIAGAVKDPSQRRQSYWLACAVSPLGVLLRWFLGAYNGGLFAAPWLPVGTLAANVLGSAASAGLSDLRGGAMRDPAAAALWRSALQTGFCGGLTTISTWVLELSQLTIKRQARKHGYAYGLLTMALCVTVGILPTYFGPWGRLRAPKRL